MGDISLKKISSNELEKWIADFALLMPKSESKTINIGKESKIGYKGSYC